MTHPGRPSLPALIAGFLTIYLVWGSTYLAIRVAVQTMPPFLMASARFVLAGIILMAYLLARGKFAANIKQWRDNVIIGAFMLLGGNGLVVWAEQEVPSGIATLVISSNPLFVVMAEWLLAAGIWSRFGSTAGYSRASLATWMGLLLGFAGLGLLIGPSLMESGGSGLDALRLGALVLACVSWTIGTFATRQVSQPTDPFSGAAIQMLGGGIWLGLSGYLLGEPAQWHWQSISMWSWLAWAYLLIAGSLVAFTTFIWLTKHCSPTLVSTYAYVNPIVAVFLGWLILNEEVSPRIFLAAAVIIGGVALITFSKRNAKSKPTESE